VGCMVSHVVMWTAQFSGVDCHVCSPPGSHEGCCPTRDFDSFEGLFRAFLSVDVDYRTAGALNAAVNAITAAECYQPGLYFNCSQPPPTPAGKEGLHQNLCYALECGGEYYSQTMIEMTYRHSIGTLYYQEGWKHDNLRPGSVWPARPAAYLLFAWSFLWPHVKLLAMHLIFYLPLPTGVRRNTHFWLAFFGSTQRCTTPLARTAQPRSPLSSAASPTPNQMRVRDARALP
jgi:hypothetical protein